MARYRPDRCGVTGVADNGIPVVVETTVPPTIAPELLTNSVRHSATPAAGCATPLKTAPALIGNVLPATVMVPPAVAVAAV